MRDLLSVLTLWGVICFSSGAILGDEPQAQEKAAAKAESKEKAPAENGDKPATFTVEEKPLKIEVEVEGIFEAQHTREIAVRTEEWNQLAVEWVIEHGQHVKKGAELLRFDARQIDIALADLKAELESAKLAEHQTEASLERLEKSVPESLAAARRAAREAEENRERFQKQEKADLIKDSEQNLKQAERSLSYQQEELKQLEKMYKADDLTEETEEIVLIRARHHVEAYQYMLEKARKGKERFDRVTLPRYDLDLTQAVTQTALALKNADDTLPVSLTETRLSLEKMRTSLRRNEKKLARLRLDRDELTVVAPTEGIVYYGQAVRGKWPSAGEVARSLTYGSLVKPNQVVLTIVKNDDLVVRTTLDEKDLHQVKQGGKVTVTPAAFPKLKLAGNVDRISLIPSAPGKFEADISLADTNQINAGMGCKVAILVVQTEKAILVPSSAVKQDADREDGYVYLVKGDDQREKKTVQIGHKQGENLEIVSGLKAGDKILKKNPDE